LQDKGGKESTKKGGNEVNGGKKGGRFTQEGPLIQRLFQGRVKLGQKKGEKLTIRGGEKKAEISRAREKNQGVIKQNVTGERGGFFL